MFELPRLALFVSLLTTVTGKPLFRLPADKSGQNASSPLSTHLKAVERASGFWGESVAGASKTRQALNVAPMLAEFQAPKRSNLVYSGWHRFGQRQEACAEEEMIRWYAEENKATIPEAGTPQYEAFRQALVRARHASFEVVLSLNDGESVWRELPLHTQRAIHAESKMRRERRRYANPCVFSDFVEFQPETLSPPSLDDARMLYLHDLADKIELPSNVSRCSPVEAAIACFDNGLEATAQMPETRGLALSEPAMLQIMLDVCALGYNEACTGDHLMSPHGAVASLHELREDFAQDLERDIEACRLRDSLLQSVDAGPTDPCFDGIAITHCVGKTFEELLTHPALERIPAYAALDRSSRETVMRQRMRDIGEDDQFAFGSVEHSMASTIIKCRRMLRLDPEDFALSGDPAELYETLRALESDWLEHPSIQLTPFGLFAVHLAQSSGYRVVDAGWRAEVRKLLRPYVEKEALTNNALRSLAKDLFEKAAHVELDALHETLKRAHLHPKRESKSEVEKLVQLKNEIREIIGVEGVESSNQFDKVRALLRYAQERLQARLLPLPEFDETKAATEILSGYGIDPYERTNWTLDTDFPNLGKPGGRGSNVEQFLERVNWDSTVNVMFAPDGRKFCPRERMLEMESRYNREIKRHPVAIARCKEKFRLKGEYPLKKEVRDCAFELGTLMRVKTSQERRQEKAWNLVLDGLPYYGPYKGMKEGIENKDWVSVAVNAIFMLLDIAADDGPYGTGRPRGIFSGRVVRVWRTGLKQVRAKVRLGETIETALGRIADPSGHGQVAPGRGNLSAKRLEIPDRVPVKARVAEEESSEILSPNSGMPGDISLRERIGIARQEELCQRVSAVLGMPVHRLDVQDIPSAGAPKLAIAPPEQRGAAALGKHQHGQAQALIDDGEGTVAWPAFDEHFAIRVSGSASASGDAVLSSERLQGNVKALLRRYYEASRSFRRDFDEVIQRRAETTTKIEIFLDRSSAATLVQLPVAPQDLSAPKAPVRQNPVSGKKTAAALDVQVRCLLAFRRAVLPMEPAQTLQHSWSRFRALDARVKTYQNEVFSFTQASQPAFDAPEPFREVTGKLFDGIPWVPMAHRLSTA